MTQIVITKEHKQMVNVIALLERGLRLREKIKAISEAHGVDEHHLWSLVRDLVKLKLAEPNIYIGYTLSYKGREYFCELNGIDYEEYTRSLEVEASKETRVRRKAGLPH